MWEQQKKESPTMIYPSVIDGLKKIYESKIKPLEQTYMFEQFHSPILRESDFDAKPTILLLGQYSVGKTSFIRFLLERDFPGMNIGPEPTTDRFSAIYWGKQDLVTPGNALTVQSDQPFRALSKFGIDFLNKFQGCQCPSNILEDLTFVDTPGVLSGEKQRIGRSYDFPSVVEWFAERSDLILLLFDAHKLDISDEFKSAIESLKGNEDKVRVVLNKSDMITGQQLMRVYGALMWSLGKVLKTPEVSRVFIGSFWDRPYQNDEYKQLFEAEKKDLLAELFALPRNNTVRKINELVKRARLAKTHAYIVSYLRGEMPTMFGKAKKQQEMLDGLKEVFFEIHKKYMLPVGDFPNLTRFRDRLRHFDFTKFAKLNQKLIDTMDSVLAEDIPKLIKQFPQERALSEKGTNPFEDNDLDPFSSISPSSNDLITQEERTRYSHLFAQLNPTSGKASGKIASQALSQSGLPKESLSKIWRLSDKDQDGCLSEEEFIIAMWLVNNTLAGHPIPEQLPPSLTNPGLSRKPTFSETSLLNPSLSSTNLIPTYLNQDPADFES